MSTRSLELLAFGRAVREAREQKGMSTAELAAAAGLGRKRVEAIEAGRRDPRYDGLRALANGLGVQRSVLLYRAGDIETEVRRASRLAPGERQLTPGEFEQHLGSLPTDGEG
jgi:transcriptional regulator with XRE-family HTH domain